MSRFARLYLAVAIALSSAAALAQGVTFSPGELKKTAVASADAVTLTTSTTSNTLTSIGLDAGAWTCAASAVSTGAGTTFPLLKIGFNTTDATLPTAPAGGYAQCAGSAGTGAVGCVSRAYFLNLTAAATEYVVVNATFTGTAPTAYGEVACIRIR